MISLGKRTSDLFDAEPGPWLLNKRNKAKISQLNFYSCDQNTTGPSFDFKMDNTGSTAPAVAPTLTQNRSPKSSQEKRKLKDCELGLKAFGHLAKRFHDAVSEVQNAHVVVKETEALLKSPCEAASNDESSQQSLINTLAQASDVRRKRVSVEKEVTAQSRYHRGPEVEAEVEICRAELEALRKLEIEENGNLPEANIPAVWSGSMDGMKETQA
ncbi:hypothetical protein BKA59DRAFT_460437 [Fusarium tricinctum]|uniref:Uncharacterized protein n=1 Tax=Fusarium tricinctum TaxID=61284 RepID=A0A8K0RKV2_9HYPO|nr:hypothetical protein BKA59DRAFT_460437 [Fusarium tricinctum]